MRLAALAAVAAISLGACAGGSQVSGDRRVVGGVSMTFSIRPARVEVGQSVRFTLRLNNHTGRTERLSFPTGQHYDFWVTRGDEEVWRWSDEMFFTQALTERTIATQNSIALAESWTADTPGRFVVHGRVLAEGYDRDLRGELIVGE